MDRGNYANDTGVVVHSWQQDQAELWAAYHAAQAECRNVAFDSKNSHFGSQYASLAAVRDEVVPTFHRHGLAVVQSPYTTPDGPEVVTRVVNAKGAWAEVGRICLPPSKKDPQGWASAITYARRISLLMLAGVTGDYDDDGNEASAAAQPVKSGGSEAAKNVAKKIHEATVARKAG